MVEMRRVLVGSYVVELAILILLFLIDMPGTTTARLATLGGSIVLAALVVAFFIGIPAALKVLLDRRGATRVARTFVGLGILGLVAATYIVFIVPTVWDAYGICWTPAVIEAGNCELGPM